MILGWSSIARGEMAEWSIAAVLKTVEGQPSQGSNPCLSARISYRIIIFALLIRFVILFYLGLKYSL